MSHFSLIKQSCDGDNKVCYKHDSETKEIQSTDG